MRKHLLMLSLATLVLAHGTTASYAQQGSDRSMMEDRQQMMQKRGAHMGDRRGGGMPGMMGRPQGMMGPHMMRMMMIMMDTDGDGALSLEEVQAVHERMFNAIDADSDGRVTYDEMRSFMHGGDFELEQED